MKCYYQFCEEDVKIKQVKKCIDCHKYYCFIHCITCRDMHKNKVLCESCAYKYKCICDICTTYIGFDRLDEASMKKLEMRKLQDKKNEIKNKYKNEIEDINKKIQILL